MSRPDPDLLKVDLTDLKSAIDDYHRIEKAKGLDGVIHEFRSPTDCTWDDVFKQLDAVKMRRDESERQGLGLLRRMWRELGQRAMKVDPWLDLIPDEYGLGFVRMGLTIALSVCGNREKERCYPRISVVNLKLGALLTHS